MLKYTVAYTRDGWMEILHFTCMAEDKAHAEEQFWNAEPSSGIMIEGIILNNPPPTLYWVAVYHVGLRYGGPEEGGWWYDAGSLVVNPDIYKSINLFPQAFGEESDAIAHMKLMQSALDSELPKSSVISEGVYEAHIHDCVPPAGFPTERPRYE